MLQEASGIPASRHSRDRPAALDAATSARMGRVRQKGTSAELAVRAALAELGLRYRLANRDLPGSPDMANRRGKWAVFVHGCFWHRHPGCVRTTTPKNNAEFWQAKFRANVARDEGAIGRLKDLGFRVLVIWECESEDEAHCGLKVRQFLSREIKTAWR